MSRALGSFEIKLTPQDDGSGSALGRMTLDKQFYGDLAATSRGQMLSTGTAVKGSAGYVAIEIVSGTLGGLSGGFALQHSGTMNRGTPSLSIDVVPDSGTGQLTGLTGTMKINIVDGKHTYDFEYTAT
jgi:predicted flavoprotein YhiN